MARVDPHVSRVAVKVRVLGSFEVVADGRCATPTAPKLRQALALLVLEHNKIVPTHALIDELWGEAPPRQATRTVHTYIYEIRRGLRAFADADRTLVTRPNGYMAAIRPEDLDVTTFESAVRDASGALARHEPDRARQLLGDALALWRERPLSNVQCGRVLDAFVARLDESWLRAVELRIDADFQLNRHHDLVGELKALSAANRFHEGVHEKLMLALYRCGRRNEALEVYRRLHHRLAEELGLSPGSQVQRLQQLMLFADPALDPPGVPRRSSVASRPLAPPAQLPPDIPDFTGRRDLVADVSAVLAAHRARAVVPLVSVTGMPGAGKTAAAVRIAHTVRAEYPDGQLFATLCRASGRPIGPARVLASFLRGVGADVGLPAGVDELVAAFRTWSSRRRVLVVLDDADSSAQVEPLLPSGARCAVLVTSRFPLYGLPVLTRRVDVFDVDDGVELLARVVGRDRVADEPAAAADIVRAVGGLPLAIRFLGQRLVSTRPPRLDQFAVHLKASGRDLLGELAHAGLDLRARLAASYRKLSAADRAAFRLLAALPRDEFTAAEATEVFLGDVLTAELTLSRLADAQLVRAVGEDCAGVRRFGLHELVRPYTLECVAADPGGSAVGLPLGPAVRRRGEKTYRIRPRAGGPASVKDMNP
jgi:DNA-binding SARP family transcriptional activator